MGGAAEGGEEEEDWGEERCSNAENAQTSPERAICGNGNHACTVFARAAQTPISQGGMPSMGNASAHGRMRSNCAGERAVWWPVLGGRSRVAEVGPQFCGRGMVQHGVTSHRSFVFDTSCSAKSRSR